MTLKERLPDQFPRYDDFDSWVEAHESEIEHLEADIEDVKKSFQIANAEGQSLDLIGDDFGILGERRGRDDAAYRSVLLSLVQSFSGRGTLSGLKTAVGAGILASADMVTIHEYFDELEYQLELNDWDAHSSTTIRELSELADPSVVNLREPVIYVVPRAELTAQSDDTTVAGFLTVTDTDVVIVGGGTVTVDIEKLADAALVLVQPEDTTASTVKVGLSGHRLGNGNTLGDGL